MTKRSTNQHQISELLLEYNQDQIKEIKILTLSNVLGVTEKLRSFRLL